MTVAFSSGYLILYNTVPITQCWWHVTIYTTIVSFYELLTCSHVCTHAISR